MVNAYRRYHRRTKGAVQKNSIFKVETDSTVCILQ